MESHARKTLAALFAVASGLAVVLALTASAGGGPAAERAAPEPVAGAEARGLEAYGSLPLTFVENRGQTDARVRYYAQGSRYAFYFTPAEIVLSFLAGADRRAEPATSDASAGAPRSGAEAVPVSAAAKPTRGVALRLRFPGSNPRVVLEGAEREPGRVNYLRGNDPAQWQTGLPAYRAVVYRELWPGVDLVLRGQRGALKYEFRVRPGARLADIRLAYAGADGLALARDGALLVETALGELRDAPPVSYQEIDGARVPVESRYVVKEGEYGFAVGAHRPEHELVIDPGLDYSTFLGGSSGDSAAGIAVDAERNAYLVGTTQSTDFPTTAGAFDRTFNGGGVDVFVAKLSADGSSLVYATYLGGVPTPLRRGSGDPFEFGRGIAVDASGHAYVTGQTTSGDFPTTAGAFQRTINASPDDATDGFVAKLDPSGSGLVYSTFLGGTNFEDTDGIAIDSSGNAYVTGRTLSDDFPTTSGAFQTTRSGGFDGFVTKLNADGSGLVYSTFIGGTDNEVTENVVVDADGNAYVAGASRSDDFPTTPGAFQPTHPGGDFVDLFTAFVAKLSADGSDLVYSTFLGGTKRELASDVAVDAGGHAYVSGATLSPEFPTTPGAFDTVFTGSSEAFVTKLAADGSELVYSTFLNGGAAAAIALDAENNAWLAGGTSRTDAPTTADAFSRENSGAGDVWIGLLNAAGSDLLHATYFGGVSNESASDIALDPDGDVYLTGTTRSFDLPTTQGAFQTTLRSADPTLWGDVFVAKFGSGAGTVNPPPPPPTRTDTFSGRIDKNQTLAHSVSVGARGTIELHLDWAESRARLSLRGRDPSGNVVFLDTGTARPKSGSFEATVTGTYRFEVVNDSSRRTDYTLSVTVPVSTTTFPAALSLLTIDPTSVTGGTPSTGTVALTAAAPPEGASVELASSDPAAATVPATVTVPAGQTSATFTISTSSVTVNTTSIISASYGGVTRTETLGVNAAGGAALSTLALDPATVTGGDASTATVTLTGPAPSGGAVVTLTSSNTAVATVPPSVTVPAGSTSATFAVSTAPQDFDQSSAISASHGGVTRTVILAVKASAASDTVTITRLEYDGSKSMLRVEASSSSGGATLRAYVTSTDQFIGTLSGGRGEFSWPTNPQTVTVRSSLGGSATQTVTLK